MYSGRERWPEARERLPGKLLLEQRFENNDGVDSEYLGEELPWLREGTNTDASICSRKKEDSSMKEGVEKSRWSQQGNGQGVCGWEEAAVTVMRSSWGQDGGKGGGSVPSLLINLPVRQAPKGLACKKSTCNSEAAGDVLRSLDQEDPLEEETATHTSILT